MTTATQNELITPEQHAEFEEQGYLILRQVIPQDALAGARAEIDKLVDDEAAKLLQKGLITDPLKDEPFETRLLRLYENCLDEAPNQFREELHLAGLFPIFFNEKALNVAEQFLGPEVRLYPNYTIRPKLPDHAASLVLWHQDGGYTAINSPEAQGQQVGQLRMINVWSPLVPARRQNGCMQFVPGTHKLGVVPHETREFYLEIADEYLKPREASAIDVELDPGDIVLFHNLLFHRGLPNLSQSVRWSFDWRYQDATQETMRSDVGHIARSRANSEQAIKSPAQWASEVFK